MDNVQYMDNVQLELTRRFLCPQEQNSCPSALRPTSLNRSPGPLASPNSAKFWSSPTTEAKRRAFWSSPVSLPKRMARVSLPCSRSLPHQSHPPQPFRPDRPFD